MTAIERHNNPVLSYSAEQAGELGAMVVRFHDPDTIETIAEFHYDNIERPEGVGMVRNRSAANERRTRISP